MKKLDTRRILIITISLLAGTALSALFFYKRTGSLGPNEFSNLFINLLFGIAVVFGVAIFLARKK
jgi:hypothetical protein